MSDLLWLSKAQMRRIEPCFPLAHDVPRVDDRRIVSGIMFGRRRDRRSIHTRDDRCAHAFKSAICIAATVICWLNQ